MDNKTMEVWETLGTHPTRNPSTVKAAYQRQEQYTRDPAKLKRLRRAYKIALAHADQNTSVDNGELSDLDFDASAEAGYERRMQRNTLIISGAFVLILTVIYFGKGFWDEAKWRNAIKAGQAAERQELLGNLHVQDRHQLPSPEDTARFLEAMELLKTDPNKAAASLTQLVEQYPNEYEFLNQLALVQATSTEQHALNLDAALRSAKALNTLTNYQNADYLATLATAYAALEQFEPAIAHQRQALEAFGGAAPQVAIDKLDLYQRKLQQ